MNTQQFFKFIKGKRVALCGIGRSHIPLVPMFISRGAEVILRDKRDAESLGEIVQELEKQGAKLVLGEDYLANLDEDIIFRTPGMKYYLPEFTAARKAGKIVTSEMEVFLDLCPCKIYGITGSDGKTTTTTIISELLKAEGKAVHLGGNIGNPLLPMIEKISPEDIAVVELSSFQLISMRKSPDVAVLTNVRPNHLDIHKDMEEYISAKKNIFLHQSAFSRTVLYADEPHVRAYEDEVRGECLLFSRKDKISNGAYFNNETIFSFGEEIVRSDEIKLLGLHNIDNLMAAICAVQNEVSNDTIRRVMKDFKGVEHRMEFVREFSGVQYYNDSIASSPTRTMNGTLAAAKEKLILICGGYDKQLDYTELGVAINDKVKVLVLMGDTAKKIKEATISAPNFNASAIEIIEVETMEEAVNVAKEKAREGDIVSLSPASAAFDIYKDFEDRARHFKEIVNALT